MKNTLLIIALAALAAGNVGAQDGPDRPYGKKARHRDGGQPVRCGAEARGGKECRGGPMSPEMREQMRADYREIKALGQAARAVTNETAKAEIVAQLRAKLGEVADRMQGHQEARLARAEEQLAELKTKIETAKTQRDVLIEEQIQRILSGERPPVPACFKDKPHAKRGLRGGPDHDRGARRQGGRGMPPHPKPAPPPADEETHDDAEAPPPAE